jgi:hypothetical protein
MVGGKLQGYTAASRHDVGQPRTVGRTRAGSFALSHELCCWAVSIKPGTRRIVVGIVTSSMSQAKASVATQA